jgi:SH3-like domain-containing protein
MKRIATGIVALSIASVTFADPLYVSDKLVVNVYAEADQESSKVTTLDSGDAVDSIEKVDTYTHVRLADNREGWIKSSYLTAQVPAVVRLKELEKERGANAPAPSSAQLAKLNDELKQVKEQNAGLQAELAAAKKIAPPAPVIVQPTPKHAEAEHAVLNQAPPDESDRITWITAIALLCVAIGFTLGYQTLARKIRRKYGSVRIY